MAYADVNFKSKKSFKEAVATGKQIRCFCPGIGTVPENGKVCVEGPHYPEPHKWYAEVEIKNGVVVKVK